MAEILIDRMTINWTGKDDLATARQLRQLAGKRNLNQIIKTAIREHLHKLNSK